MELHDRWSLAQMTQWESAPVNQRRRPTMSHLLWAAIGGRMSCRPEYYSGYAAASHMLSAQYLECFFQAVTIVFGEKAGRNFVQMVADINSLAPTAFLTAFRSFIERDKCEWKKQKHSNIDLGNDHESTIAMGYATIGAAYGGNGDATELIRSNFLEKHKGEFKGTPKCMTRGFDSFTGRMYEDSYDYDGKRFTKSTR